MVNNMNNLEKKNFIWNILGLSLYSFTSLFLMIIITRVNGLDMSGLFNYAFSLACLFYYVSIFYNRTFYVANNEKKYDFDDLFSFRIFTTILSFVLILVFALINKFNSYKVLVIAMIMLIKSIDSISDCLYGEIHKNNKLYKVGVSLSVKSFLGVLFFLVVDLTTKNLMLSLIIYLIVNIVFLLTYDIKALKLDYKDTFKYRKQNFKIIFLESFSIFLFSFISNLLCSTQKLLLTYFVSNEIQSIFGIIIMPATVLSLIGGYLINPYVTKFISYRDNKDLKSFNSLFIKLIFAIFICGFLCVIGGYLLCVPILNIVYGLVLDSYRFYIVLILVGATFLAITSIISSCLTVLNCNTKQLVVYIISSIISLVLSYVLISKNLIDGAVYAYLITFVIHFVLFIILYITTIRKESKKWIKL